MQKFLRVLRLTCGLVMLMSVTSKAADVNPMETSCADEVTARNNKSVAHWSVNIPLTPTSNSQWLMNSETGYSAKIELNQYEYLRDTGAPVWTIVRFYKTKAVDKGIARRATTPTLQGFSNNLMFVQADGSCYVSEDRFDDLKYYTQKVAYLLGRTLTSMSMGAPNGEIPPQVDAMLKDMTLQDLRLPIDAAVQNLIKQQETSDAVYDPSRPQIANLCKSPMARVMVMIGDLKNLNVMQSKIDGNFENFDDLQRYKKPLTALCFEELDANYVAVKIPREVTRCSFIRGDMECYTK
ncbi:hypothetical protein [Rhizobium leguminosarum]|uniref:hypothetical protein n=1 Tax=Rhizobium leguminosarum TaxID=384 RepID=UPI0013BDD11C|nr:hypothetical protein [Rhizobium leguminosarum]NEI65002.1 hypothetical protein [Rhizobium leguminosarum]